MSFCILILSESLLYSPSYNTYICSYKYSNKFSVFFFRLIMDKKQTKVKVVVRLRPLLKSEDKVNVFADGKSVEIFNHRNLKENIKYE